MPPDRREFARAETIRGAVRLVREFVVRLGHPWRRVVARRRVRRAAVLGGDYMFVCFGNICRSPFAAAIARQRHQVRADSAGLFGPDRPSPPQAIAAARRRGADLATHRSKLMTAALARPCIVVVMEARQADEVRALGVPAERITVLSDLDPLAWQTRTIPDPFGTSDETYDAVFLRIERCVAALVVTAARANGRPKGATP